MDMRLVQIMGDRRVMGQWGAFVLLFLQRQEGKACLVFSCSLFLSLTFMAVCFLKRRFVIKLRVKACLLRVL